MLIFTCFDLYPNKEKKKTCFDQLAVYDVNIGSSVVFWLEFGLAKVNSEKQEIKTFI